MKYFSFILFFLSSIALAQMPNIYKVWLNNSQPYSGFIGDDKSSIKVKINFSEQNKKNDQEYFVSGYTLVNQSNYTKFEGKIKIAKYMDRKKGGTVYGDYEFAEENKGPHSGKIMGKFIFNFKWNKEKESIEDEYIKFSGIWQSYDKKLRMKTIWSNQ